MKIQCCEQSRSASEEQAFIAACSGQAEAGRRAELCDEGALCCRDRLVLMEGEGLICRVSVGFLKRIDSVIQVRSVEKHFRYHPKPLL